MTFQWNAYLEITAGGYGGLTQLELFKEARKIGENLIAAGWVRSSDTGQVDWDALAAVPAVGALTIWEMFQPGDDLAADFPFRVKIIHSIQGSDNLAHTIFLGRATDGAGAFVGSVLAANTQPPNALPGPVKYAMYADSGSLFLMAGEEQAQQAGYLFVERSRANNGDPTDEYVTLVGAACSSSGNQKQQTLMKDGSTGPYRNARPVWVHMIPLDAMVLSAFGTTPISPGFPLVGKFGNPFLNVAFCRLADMAYNTGITVTSYGRPVQYRAVAGSSEAAYNGGNYVQTLMRWE